MAILEWLPAAQEDLVRLHEFILPHSEQAAGKAVVAIVDAIGVLADFPETGHPWQPDTSYKELPIRFGAKGYVARYRLLDERVIIVRVWHALEDRLS